MEEPEVIIDIFDIFTPTEKEMKMDYPELNDIDEFKDMSNNDIKYCWYMGCESSPYAKGFSSHDRGKYALIEAYGKDYMNDRTALSIVKQEIPIEIINGINRMKVFSPGLRSKANNMLSTIFKNFETLIKLDPTDIMAMTEADKKSYISTCVQVTATLPNLVNQLEGGFSLSKVKAVKKGGNNVGNALEVEDEGNFMDRVVSSNENNTNDFY